MSLTLTPDTLRRAYDYLDSTPPFNKWNLPEAEDIVFRVVRTPAFRGWYRREDNKHVIAISRRCVGRTIGLLETMAHEMVHLHEEHVGACTAGQHSAAFHRWAAQVCKHHGFDPATF